MMYTNVESFVSTLFNESKQVLKDNFSFIDETRFHSFLAAVAAFVILWLVSECFFKNDEDNDVVNTKDQQSSTAAEQNIKKMKESTVEGVDYDWLPESSLPDEWKEQKSKKLRKRRPLKAN